MIELFDTHCHIQESSASVDGDDHTNKLWAKIGHPNPADMVHDAVQQGVTRMMCVGCTLQDSERAIAVAMSIENVWASIGIHPHEAKAHLEDPKVLERFAFLAKEPLVKAIGECGLDYYYEHSLRDDQQTILRFQLELATKHNLPVIFHVRQAFDDFWPIIDEYKGVRGVLHSFTATSKQLQKALDRGLYIGLNGIMTFTKSEEQLAVAKAVPTDRMLLETDAPYLTPKPYRGNICLPKHTRVTAEFLAHLRGESLAD